MRVIDVPLTAVAASRAFEAEARVTAATTGGGGAGVVDFSCFEDMPVTIDAVRMDDESFLGGGVGAGVGAGDGVGVVSANGVVFVLTSASDVEGVF